MKSLFNHWNLYLTIYPPQNLWKLRYMGVYYCCQEGTKCYCNYTTFSIGWVLVTECFLKLWFMPNYLFSVLTSSYLTISNNFYLHECNLILRDKMLVYLTLDFKRLQGWYIHISHVWSGKISKGKGYFQFIA